MYNNTMFIYIYIYCPKLFSLFHFHSFLLVFTPFHFSSDSSRNTIPAPLKYDQRMKRHGHDVSSIQVRLKRTRKHEHKAAQMFVVTACHLSPTSTVPSVVSTSNVRLKMKRNDLRLYILRTRV